MNKKIRDAYSNISVSKELEEKILNHTVNKNMKNYKIKKWAAILGVFVLFVMATCVYAEEIGNVIKKWGGVDRKFSNGEIMKEEEKSSITTKIDDVSMDELEYEDVFLSSQQIKDYLGIHFITFGNGYERENKNSYYSASIYVRTDQNTPQLIHISQSGYTTNKKRVYLSLDFITKNFQQEYMESYNNDTVIDYNDLHYIDKVQLEKFNIEATVYTFTRMDEDKNFYETYTIEFTHNNMKYRLIALDSMELEELVDVLNHLEKSE